MIDEFKTLCRVKGLHEQNKLRALRTKRAEVVTALQKEDEQRRIAAQSRAELPHKEAALFDAIMNVSVSVSDIDETKSKVLNLQEKHQEQEDEAERLTQIRVRCETEHDEARVQYQIAQRNFEKFTTIETDLVMQQRVTVEAQEEAEIEDMFSRKQEVHKWQR